MAIQQFWSRDYFDIEWDTNQSSITVRSNWFYEWCVWPGLNFNWSGSDKTSVHNTFEHQIMSAWSKRFKFKVSGSGPFATKYTKSGISLDFDVKRVIAGRRHWNVRIWKLPPNVPDASRQYMDAWPMVKPKRHYIILNDKSISRISPVTVAHEFGHIIFADDEYWQSSPFLNDTVSLMNVGTIIRGRHLYGLERSLEAITRWKFNDPTVSFQIARR